MALFGGKKNALSLFIYIYIYIYIFLISFEIRILTPLRSRKVINSTGKNPLLSSSSFSESSTGACALTSLVARRRGSGARRDRRRSHGEPPNPRWIRMPPSIGSQF